MKVYHLKRTQFLPLSLKEAWSFFSKPGNLEKITPTDLSFNIRHISGEEKGIYPGQIITYKIGVFPFIKTNWVTEITHVQAPFYFVDEQRFGPYALWHHQHHFREVQGGVEMTDEVTYAIPLGIIGRLANSLFVANRLNTIFNFRFSVLEELFTKNELVKKSA